MWPSGSKRNCAGAKERPALSNVCPRPVNLTPGKTTARSVTRGFMRDPAATLFDRARWLHSTRYGASCQNPARTPRRRGRPIGEPDPRVTHRNQQLTIFSPLRPDAQFTPFILHHIDAIEHEIYQHLLQLHTVSCRRRKCRV